MEPKPDDIDRELEHVIQLVLAGKKDHPLVQRARERGDALRKEMRAKYGDRNIAVELVREARDDGE